MTRKSPNSLALRTVMALTPALLVTGVAVALVGGGRATEASAGAVSATPAPACLTDELAGIVTGRGGHRVREAVLSLTNTAGHACRLPGRAEVALVTPPGEVVRVPTAEVGTAGPAIVLEPGATASAGLEWDTCPAGRAGCGAGVAFQFIVDPDSAGIAADVAGLPEADGPGIAMKALRVGPLQAR